MTQSGATLQADALSTGRRRIALIGFGERTLHMAKLVCAIDGGIGLAAVADPNVDAARRRAMLLPGGDRSAFYCDVDDWLDHADDCDAVMIGTPCSSHASIATAIARRLPHHTPVFLEKPVATTHAQLAELAKAYTGRESSVLVSFPLRLTAHVRAATTLIRAGRLGAINQIQAVNNVSYGGVYFGQWYRDYGLTGGLWMQKATHDLDYVNLLMAAGQPGVRPMTVMAMHSRQVYGGDMPAGLHCSGCDRAAVCPESPQNLLLRGDDGGMLNHTSPASGADHACAFGCEIMNQDAGSALMQFSNGSHASYSQNFLTRRSAAQRGVTVTGYKATLRFDWQTDLLTVIDHHVDHVERIPVDGAGNHGGGDDALARNFVDMIRGRDYSRCTLTDGLLSAAVCLAARDSASDGIAHSIPWGASAVEQTARRPRGPVEPV